MNQQQFETLFQEQVQREQEVLIDRAKSYMRGNDRLSNFRRAASLLGCSSETALMGMLAKHTVALQYLVDDIEGGLPWNPLAAREYITDSRNYLMLLLALIEENKEWKATQND